MIVVFLFYSSGMVIFLVVVRFIALIYVDGSFIIVSLVC